MSSPEAVYAALILPDATGLNDPAYLETAADILFDRDGNVSVEADTGLAIGPRWRVLVESEENGEFGPAIRVEMLDASGRTAKSEDAAHTLAAIVVAMLRHSECDVIEWCVPGALVERDEFLETCGVDPATVPPVRALAEPTELHQLRSLLTARCEAVLPTAPILTRHAPVSPAQSRLGAASWLMTAALSFISAPAAIALGIFGLLRGMEFRMVTQVMSVVSLFAVLGDAGAIAQILQTVTP